MKRRATWFAAGFLGAAGLAFGGAAATADPVPPGWQARNLEPIGYNDVNGRRAGFKITINQVGGRWYLYRGSNGIEVFDVTDPTDPKILRIVPGPPNTSASRVSLNGDLLLLGLSRSITADESAGRADGWTVLQDERPSAAPHR